MYTKVIEGEVLIDLPYNEKVNNQFIQNHYNDLVSFNQRQTDYKQKLIGQVPERYMAKVSKEGVDQIHSLMPEKSTGQVQHYVDYIEWRLSKILFNGTSILEFHEMTKTYKGDWFQGAKNNFTSLKGLIFIPYINPKSGKESYVKGQRGKCYRINPTWIKKNVTFELANLDKVIETKKVSEMIGLNKSKCQLMDANLKLISVVPNLIDDEELVNTARENISSYLLKTDSNTYEYSHKKLGLLSVKMSSLEYQVFSEVDSLIQSKYLKYRLTQLISSARYAKRNEYEGRLYHPLTNFPKSLYKYILFDREQIHEIDMANCFPSLLILSMLGKYDPYNLFQGNQYLKAFKLASTDKNKPIYWLVKAAKEGSFYEYISTLLFPKLSDEKRLIRKRYIKTQVSKILFGKYNSTSWIKEKLKKKIPLFIKIIDTQKRRYVRSFKQPQNKKYYNEYSKHGKKSPFKTGNDIISILGMRTESTLFIDKIFLHLLQIPFLTKHDAVLCPKSRASNVLAIMGNVLDKELGRGNYLLKASSYKSIKN